MRKVFRIFPNEALALRLIGVGISEEWETSLSQYINYTDKTKRALIRSTS